MKPTKITKPNKPYTLSKRKKYELLKMYATGAFSQGEIGEVFGITRQAVSSIIKHNKQSYLVMKEESKRIIDKEYVKFIKKAIKLSRKNVSKMSPYKQLVASAVAHDKVYPPRGKDLLIDQRKQTIRIEYPNWKKKLEKRGQA